MNEEDVYCMGIQQIEAAQRFIKINQKTLLMGHLGHCSK